MTVTFQDRDTNLRTVGAPGPYNHSSVQAALDWILANGSPARDNPYVVAVSGLHTVTSPVVHNAPFTYVVGERGAVIRSTTTTSGVFIIGDASDGSWTDTVKDAGLAYLTIVHEKNVAPASAPEAAVYIGGEEDYPTATKPYDNVEVAYCRIIGDHDGFQAFGMDDSAYATSSRAPVIDFHHNLVKARHDACTMKGSIELHSNSNTIHSNPRATVLTEYLPNTGIWKQTGWHVNLLRPNGNDVSVRNTWAGLFSHGDKVFVYGAPNQVNDGVAGQATIAGFYFYDQDTAGVGDHGCFRFHITGAQIRVEGDDSASGDTEVCARFGGVVVAGTAIDSQFGVEEHRVEGCRIYVRQIGDTAYSPATVDGVLVDCGGAASGNMSVSVSGCSVYASNAKSGGAAYSLRTVDAGGQDQIRYRSVASGQATSDGSGSSITQLTLGSGLS